MFIVKTMHKRMNFVLLVSVTDVISQFVMLYMMLSLSLGWAQAAAYKYHHSTLAQLKEKPAAKIVAAIGVLQVRPTPLIPLSDSLSTRLS